MHDDPSRIAGTERARQMLAQSEKALDEILTAFDLMAERIRAGADVPATEMARSFTALSQARTRLINEVKEHDKRVLLAEGVDAAAPLDLEAVRVEIGRRLDRIRAALDEENIPGDA